jgi:hypothetical protein
MKVLPQALEIIFEVQRKKSNEKITRKKKSLLTYKTIKICMPLFVDETSKKLRYPTCSLELRLPYEQVILI